MSTFLGGPTTGVTGLAILPADFVAAAAVVLFAPLVVFAENVTSLFGTLTVGLSRGDFASFCLGADMMGKGFQEGSIYMLTALLCWSKVRQSVQLQVASILEAKEKCLGLKT